MQEKGFSLKYVPGNDNKQSTIPKQYYFKIKKKIEKKGIPKDFT